MKSSTSSVESDIDEIENKESIPRVIWKVLPRQTILLDHLLEKVVDPMRLQGRRRRTRRKYLR
jgi:hypothetical protein